MTIEVDEPDPESSRLMMLGAFEWIGFLLCWSQHLQFKVWSLVGGYCRVSFISQHLFPKCSGEDNPQQ